MSPPPAPSLVYTVGEAAAILAVGERTILRLGREGRLRIIRLGDKSLRVPRADIAALLAGGEEATS